MPDQFESCKQKYQPVSGAKIQEEGAQLRNLNLDGNQLYLKATAVSEASKNRIWDAIKAVDPNFADLKHDIEVQQGDQSYTVQPGTICPKSADISTAMPTSILPSPKPTIWRIRQNQSRPEACDSGRLTGTWTSIQDVSVKFPNGTWTPIQVPFFPTFEYQRQNHHRVFERKRLWRKKLTLSAGALFLLLGTIAPAYAQHEHEQGEQGRPPQQQHQQARPGNNRIRKGPHRHHIRPPDPRHDRSKATAAPITAVSRPTAPPMAASTIAGSHSIRGRSATVSLNPGPDVA